MLQDGDSEERTVKHFEMVGFNDEATDAGFLLDCIRRVNTYMLGMSGPILVHCRSVLVLSYVVIVGDSVLIKT